MAKGYHLRRKRFPEIGRIRKGAPKEPNSPGKDLDHFRIDLDVDDPHYEKSKATLIAAYTETPPSLDVMMPFSTVEENFEAWYEGYLQSGLIFRADYFADEDDGLLRVRLIDQRHTNIKFDYEVGDVFDPKKPIGKYITQGGQEKLIAARPAGRMRVILPVLHRLASFTVLTGSHHDIGQLSEQLAALEDFGEKLTAIPLLLIRKPKKIKTPSGPGGAPAKRVKWLIYIEAHPTWVGQKIIEAQRATLALPDAEIVDVAPLSLPEPVEESVPAEFREAEATIETTEPSAPNWNEAPYAEADPEPVEGITLEEASQQMAESVTASRDQLKPEELVIPDMPKKTGTGSLTDADIATYRTIATNSPDKIDFTQFWTVAKHFGIDPEQGQAINKELKSWAKSMLYVIDNYMPSGQPDDVPF